MESISRARRSGTLKEEEEEDGTSKLADEIVEYIITLLPAIDAARTAVVCRRWRKLYANTMVFSSNLALVHNRIGEKYTYYQMLVEWVNRAIGLHRPACIEELTVRIGVPKQHSHSLNRWVVFAAEKRVRKLNLNIQNADIERLISYSCRWSSSNRGLYWWRLSECLLTRVKVDDADVESLLSNSPNLEVLSLRDLNTIRNLKIENAPRLESLRLCRCRSMQSLHIISAPNLKHLYISTREFYPFSGLLMSFDCRYKPLPRGCIRISSAPSLESIRFCGILETHIPFAKFPPLPSTLSYLSLGINSFTCYAYFGCLLELLTHFHNVKRLRIDMMDRVVGKIRSDQFPNQLPNLEHLEVTIRCHMNVDTLLWLCNLVKAAPLLSNLSIKLYYREDFDRDIKCSYLSSVSSHLIDFKWKEEDIHNKVKANISHSHPSLKVVEVFGFTGYRYQVELVLHLVEIAVSLEKIILDVSIPWDYWEDGTLMFNKNRSAEKSQACALLLKTVIRTGIDVLVTEHPADSPLKPSGFNSYY